MPKPNETHLKYLGEAILPFERTGFKRKILVGENLRLPFINAIYDATEDGYPDAVLMSDVTAIKQGNTEQTKYLWVIDANGLKIIPEQTRNLFSARGVVCHTNLTEGKAAIQGGELWFGTDGVLYLNNKSGRFGATTLQQRKAVIDYFNFVGYQNVKQLI